MKYSPYRGEQGFTIIELLMVTAMLGLIMGAVFSLFNVHRNAAYSQVEVVEEQQNLRIAMDIISRDLRMAGIMMPLGSNPIAAATGSDIRINVASAEERFARVTSQETISGTSVSTVTLTVESPATASAPNIVDGFANGDIVRIIRPVEGKEPISAGSYFFISATDRAANTITISMPGSSFFTEDETIAMGDMIAKVTDTTTYPETIDYYLVNGGTTINGITCPNAERCLVRRVNATSIPAGPEEIIATKMSTIGFGYLDDSYSEATAPAASDLANIRAVRVSLRGATAATAALSGGGRVRELTSIIKLRNRR